MKGAHGINHWAIHSEDNTLYIHANGQVFKEETPLKRIKEILNGKRN